MVNIESFFTSFIKKIDIIPNIIPKTIAPIVNSKNAIPIWRGCIGPPLTNYKLIVSKTIQVPSLNKLYPSINELNFLGAPASFKIAKTATVSVHESTDPNINADGYV
jgi:hypothetical protein